MVTSNRHRAVVTILVVGGIAGCSSPEDLHAQGRVLSFALGPEHTYRDESIRKHSRYTVAMQLQIFNDTALRFSYAYAQNENYWNDYHLEYMSYLYHGRDGQIFEDYTVDLGLVRRISSRVSVGAGASLHLVEIERVRFDSDLPFLLAYQADEVKPYFVEELDEKQWLPGLFLLVEGNLPLWGRLVTGLELNGRLLLDVENLMDKQQRSLITVSFSPFLRFQF